MDKRYIFEKILILTTLTLFFLFPILLHYYEKDRVVLFLLKDGSIYETLGALSALLASIFFFYLYRFNKKTLIFLLLGLILFFLFAEEISWGQSLFNFNTPKYFIDNNYQRETNIHNLNLFQNNDRALFDYGKYLIIIYFVYLTLFINIFPYFKKIFYKFKVPVGSFFVAFLILYTREWNTIINKVFNIQEKGLDILRVGEIFETSLEIIILVFAYECFKKYKKKNFHN